MRLLLVEDEKDLAESIQEYLVKDQQYNCDTANALRNASEMISLYDYNCVIVDIGLPDGSGLDLIRQLKKENKKAGIIIITAKDELDNRIEGLNMGADDYLVKPFHLPELNARIHSLLRRLLFDGEHELVVGALSIDSQSRQVKVDGEPIEFTKSEYDLLSYLVTNRNQVISKTSIAEHLVGDHVDILTSLDFVYLHIKNLRKKLTKQGCKDYIKTVYGIGYKFSAE